MTDQRFMVMLIPCRDDFWQTLSAEEQVVIRAHFEAMVALHDEGTLEFAGRDQDAKFGVAICCGDSEQHVRDALGKTPAIAGGLLRIEVSPYKLALDESPV